MFSGTMSPHISTKSHGSIVKSKLPCMSENEHIFIIVIFFMQRYKNLIIKTKNPQLKFDKGI